MAEIGSVIDGKYEILTEIGHGGMSVVYLAMDTHLNKQWAVKEIKNKCVNVGDINIEMRKSPPLSTLRLGEGAFFTE